MTQRRTALHGTARLVRVVLRRDRLRLTLWLALLGGLLIVSAASLPSVYTDQQSIDDYAALFGDNPALVAFAGPGYGFDDPNLGVILVNETQLWGMIGMAVMALFLAIRHTRAEEDVERAELIRSSVVGRHAPAVAAVVVASATVAVLSASLLVAFVLQGYALVGSVALSGSLAVVGWLFVGLAVVAAQVAATARAALISGMVVLVAAFLLRALGDIGDNALRWMSPLGWAQSGRPFAGEVWWPLVVCAGVAVGLVVTAFHLSDRRDMGSGLAAPRRGRAGTRSLRHAWRLAGRLHRATFGFWALGMFVGGAVYASVADDIDNLVRDNPAFADLLAQLEGADLVDAFFATSITILAAVSTGALVAAIVRLRTEESAGRVEALWATPLSRVRWAMGHLVVVLAGTFIVLTAAGLGLGLVYWGITDDASEVLRLTAATLTMAPGVVVLGGVSLMLVGWWPRATMASWVVLSLVVIVDFFGELLRLPNWVQAVSPFRHLPAVPAEPMTWGSWTAVAAVAMTLVAGGVAGVRRRDLQPS